MKILYKNHNNLNQIIQEVKEIHKKIQLKMIHILFDISYLSLFSLILIIINK